jgi:hypothetical protein
MTEGMYDGKMMEGFRGRGWCHKKGIAPRSGEILVARGETPGIRMQMENRPRANIERSSWDFIGRKGQIVKEEGVWLSASGLFRIRPLVPTALGVHGVRFPRDKSRGYNIGHA